MTTIREQSTGRGALQERARWRAVAAKDARFDGQFVYGVRSTRIYCRPSCPARRPRRRQVVFFVSSSAAEASGFLSCRRCRPDERPAHDAATDLVRRVSSAIDDPAREHNGLAQIAREFDLPPRRLARVFKRAMRISPREYAEASRRARFRELVRTGQPVTHALYEAGFGSSSRLYEKAAKHLGMTPATYRRGGAGELVRYATTRCVLGLILVAATDRGVCQVRIGDSQRELETGLREEFPQSLLQKDTAGLAPWIRAILTQLDGTPPASSVPLDLRATAFQWRVWKELMAIPAGSTLSYSEVARRLGRPSAVRAVARACATNPVAIVVPCHRVVRSDGTVGGYRWGLKRKEKMLAIERKAALSVGCASLA